MDNDTWLVRALQAVTPAQEDPEPTISAENIALPDWAANRAALGIAGTSDFVGVQGWSRETATRRIPREPTALELYGQQREALGVKDAGESSVVPGTGRSASQIRTNRSPWRAV